jgi:hypothetical protein
MAANDDDQVFEINTHLLYELKWMIYAAARHAADLEGDPRVALLDSATVHGRNLFEFASKRKPKDFTLAALGGTPQSAAEWTSWANNRVTHMLWRENPKARAGSTWPDGLDNDSDTRLMVMADTVLKRLEKGGGTIQIASVKAAFDTMLTAAREYWREPSEDRHQAMNALYDDSRDDRDY